MYDVMFSIYQAHCISQIIEYFGTTRKDEYYEGYIAGLGLLASAAGRSVVTHWEFEGMATSGMRIRLALSSNIYKKVNRKLTESNV